MKLYRLAQGQDYELQAGRHGGQYTIFMVSGLRCCRDVVATFNDESSFNMFVRLMAGGAVRFEQVKAPEWEAA